MQQRTDDWYQARCGKVTASRIADVVARTKAGWGASRANYAAELVAEILTDTPAEGPRKSAAMQWGIDTEPAARAAYEAETGMLVEDVGFIEHPTIVRSGASPDGYVGAGGLVEIKCPNTATHIDTLLRKTIPQKYQLQMQWQMACCPGREFCDFVSFDPRMPDKLQLWICQVERDDETIEQLETDVLDFLTEVQEKVSQLRKLL